MHTTRRSACVSKKIFYMLNHSRWMHLRRFFCLIHVRWTKPSKHIHGKEGSGSTSQFTRWCSLYEKKSSRSSFCRRSRSKLSARIHECMKNELVTLMMLQDMKCERCCRGLQRSILQVTAATNIQTQRCTSVFATEGLGTVAHRILSLCTGRPNTMYKDESSCGSGERLLPIPQPRSSPQPATQLQTNKQKTKASEKQRIYKTVVGDPGPSYIYDATDFLLLVKVSPDEIEQKYRFDRCWIN